jgi:PIN domain nuclease of toxin-antitoxin system
MQTIKGEMEANSVRWLPIEMAHCAEVEQLPFHHRDPFDRMLIGQAIAEGMRVLSRDCRFSEYPVKRIW